MRLVKPIRKAETGDNIDKGRLQIQVLTPDNIPIPGAKIVLSVTGEPQSTLEELTTDSSGQSETLELAAPPIELSRDINNDIQPYSEYTIDVSAPGYENLDVSGIEILSETESLQTVRLQPVTEGGRSGEIVIPDHTLYGNFPPKIPEAEVKPMSETGEIVLSRVVIPEYMIVHDGVPGDNTAANYYVPYTDYIKNVASCEIYATWPESTLQANILAIMSLSLNRVYTEWYRNQGYDFTITSSTAYDQKFVYGRNIFESISLIVDDIFDNFLSRPNVRQPIMTQYCDGRQVTCPNWMSQWGSKYLGDQGYSAIEILRYYYGESIYINTAEQIAGVPASWPGYTLTQGASGTKVRQMQEQLVRIAQVYSAIPQIDVDGIYGPRTAEAVSAFQRIFNLPVTGTVDFATWYQISHIYVGITRIAERVYD